MNEEIKDPTGDAKIAAALKAVRTTNSNLTVEQLVALDKKIAERYGKFDQTALSAALDELSACLSNLKLAERIERYREVSERWGVARRGRELGFGEMGFRIGR